MTPERTPLELLAPARNLECGIAAINHGADAVYIGAPKFGARSAAGNPLSDITTLIAHAHRYHARVYITLNTILFDSEIEGARSLIEQIYEAGADALIIQDMGLLELDLPPLPLFASTQAHNYDLKRIQFLERVGIKRVILARELSLKQIAAIRKETALELEFFVHGALCVSFSGQCYFSQAVMGRSANRGECAQMCRLPYTLMDGRGNVLANNQHLLSLKDLNLSEYLSDLVEAGVTSFKIEGRLKEASYVKNITAFYRSRLDALIEERSEYGRSSSGSTTFFFTPDPERTFNRGSTDYFIRRRNRDLVSLRTPKSIGKLLGVVQTVGNGFIVLDSQEELHNGDGICFFDNDDELLGVQINRVEGSKVYPDSLVGIMNGTTIYRNFDREFMQLLASDTAKRTIEVDFFLEETDDGFRLRAVDEDGCEAITCIDHPKEPANKPDAANSTVIAQLSKLGETIFHPGTITPALTQTWFLPIGTLNQLRRNCVAALESERARKLPRRTWKVVPNSEPYPIQRLDYTSNVINKNAAAFYARHGVGQVEPGLELQSDSSGKMLMTTRHCLKYQFDLCRGDKGSTNDLFLSDGKTKYKLEFDCDQCVMKIVAP
jgi:23S rRNA 5-hydroxycytidine C2501 synthase